MDTHSPGGLRWPALHTYIPGSVAHMSVEETRELRQKIQYDLRDQGRDGDKERIGTEGRCGHEEVTLEAGFQGPGTIPGNAMLTSAMAAAGKRQLIPSLEGLVGQGRYI